MKYFNLCLFLLLFFLLLSNCMNISATNTVYSTETLSPKDEATFLNNINLSYFESPPHKSTIECFDVNTDEVIVLGQKDSDKKMICVYSANGLFRYGYSFNCTGSFGVEWNNNNINIYFSRSDIIATIDSTGEIVKLTKFNSTTENNSYLNSKIYSTTRKIGDAQYELKNDIGFLNIFASSYSQLTKTLANGEATVLYDVTSTQLKNTILTFIFVLIILVATLGVFVWLLIKFKRFISNGTKAKYQ